MVRIKWMTVDALGLRLENFADGALGSGAAHDEEGEE